MKLYSQFSYRYFVILLIAVCVIYENCELPNQKGQNVYNETYCLLPKAKDLGITRVVVLGFFV